MTTTAALQIGKIGSTVSCTSTTMKRRANKPLMEKRRRARINQSLAELRNLILDYIKKESTRTNKLEKADILETTLQYLQELQRRQTAMNITTDPNIVNKFQAGYNECVKEVRRYLHSSTFDGLTSVQTMTQKVMAHITDSNCRSRILKLAENCEQNRQENVNSAQRQRSNPVHQQQWISKALPFSNLQPSQSQGEMILVLKTPLKLTGNCSNVSLATPKHSPNSDHQILLHLDISENQKCTFSSAELSDKSYERVYHAPSNDNHCEVVAQQQKSDFMWRPW